MVVPPHIHIRLSMRHQRLHGKKRGARLVRELKQPVALVARADHGGIDRRDRARKTDRRHPRR